VCGERQYSKLDVLAFGCSAGSEARTQFREQAEASKQKRIATHFFLPRPADASEGGFQVELFGKE
jgi:hypothetical protein